MQKVAKPVPLPMEFEVFASCSLSCCWPLPWCLALGLNYAPKNKLPTTAIQFEALLARDFTLEKWL